MEFLLQLDEAVISFLREGNVPQHCRYRIWPYCCSLRETNICFATNRVVHLSDIENDDTTCLLGNNQSLRLAADWADTFVTGCLQSAVETQA